MLENKIKELCNAPNSEIGNVEGKTIEIQDFINRNNFLKEDKYYTDFLLKYGGYSFFREDDSFSIYGFDDRVTLHLANGEGELVNKEGFLTIADYSFYTPAKSLSVGFSYDVTGERKKGIYRSYISSDKELNNKYFCANFFEFIEMILSGEYIKL